MYYDNLSLIESIKLEVHDVAILTESKVLTNAVFVSAPFSMIVYIDILVRATCTRGKT